MNTKLTHQIEQNAKRIKELEIRNQELDQLTSDLLDTLKLNPAQITEALNDPTRFSATSWEELKKLRKLLDEKLQRELANIADPLKIKRSYLERKIESHWLFVK